MTIDEAIIQFKEDAEYNRVDLDLEWAEENMQVAKWLEELKAIKESAVFYSNRPIEDIVLEARNDAIDEIVDSLTCHACFTNLQKDAIRIYAKNLKEQNNDD